MIKSILAVENEGDLLDLYLRLLTAPDRTVARAASLAEAEDLLEKNSYDLLITDVRLPDGLGTELIEVLKKKGSDTRTLLVGGHPGPETRGLAGKGNCIGCLEKPVDFNALISAVRKALEN